MKVLFFGDVQIRGGDANFSNQGASTKMTEMYNTLLLVAAIAQERRPDMIACLGDVFDVHTSVSIPALCLAFHGFQAINDCGIPVVVISGNHDQYSVDRRLNSIVWLEAFSSVYATEGDGGSYPELGDNGAIGFLSYHHDNVTFCARILEAKERGIRVLFCHQPVKGAAIREAFFDPTGVDASVFLGFDAVFFGHYHMPGVAGNLVFAGSSMYHDFRDEFDPANRRGPLLWDDVDGSLTWFPNSATSLYHTVRVLGGIGDLAQWPGTSDAVALRARTHLRLVGPFNLVMAAKEAALKAGYRSIQVRAEAAEQKPVERGVIHAGMGVPESIERYVDQARGRLERGHLIERGLRLVGSQ